MRECAYFAPMIVAAFWLGIYPNTFLSDIDPAVQKTVSALTPKRAIVVGEGEAPKVVGAAQAPSQAPAKGALAPGQMPPLPPSHPQLPGAPGAEDRIMNFDASQLALDRAARAR